MQQQVQISGVTEDDIRNLVRSAWDRAGVAKSKVIHVDTGYLYTFSPHDLVFVNRFIQKFKQAKRRVKENGRWVHRNPLQIEWHRMLERWYQDMTVTLEGVRVDVEDITRTLDIVPNQGLDIMAAIFAGESQEEFNAMIYHALGDGAQADSNPSPEDQELIGEVSRINVKTEPNGGDVSLDGSTYMLIGTHPISMASADLTEQGIFDNFLPGTNATFDDNMGAHSIFPRTITHDQNQNSAGGTEIIYMCST